MQRLTDILMALTLVGVSFQLAGCSKPPSGATQVTADGLPPLSYTTLAQSDLPPAERDDLQQKAINLRQTGSINRGQLTHEFRQTADLIAALQQRGGGEQGFAYTLAKLNFTPISPKVVTSFGFRPIGADVSGAYQAGKYTSLFASYQAADGQHIEISETSLAANTHTQIVIYQELLNSQIAGTPVTFQRLTTPEGQPVIDLDFATNQRMFSISSQGISESHLFKLSEQLIIQSQAAK